MNLDIITVDPLIHRSLRPTFAILGCVILVLVGVGSWFAGAQYGHLKNQQAVSKLVETQQRETMLRVQIKERNAQIEQLKKTLDGIGHQTTATQIDSQRRQLLRQQAELNNYQNLIEKDKLAMAQNEQILNALAAPGARFIPLASIDKQSAAVAYALIIEGQRVLIVASNLPKASAGREYQIWLTRTDDPKMVSANTLDPDDSNRAVAEFADTELVSNIAEIAVTDEPLGGSKGPTGKKIFVTPAKEQISKEAVKPSEALRNQEQ